MHELKVSSASMAMATALLMTVRHRQRQQRGRCLRAARVASDGDPVLVHYEGRFEDGSVFDSSKGSSPLSVTLGKRQLVPGFEEAMIGMAAGEKKTVSVPPEKAYGERDEALVFTVGAAQAPAGLAEGMEVQLGSQSGKRFTGLVVKIAEDGSVTIDANSPMAGKTLLFDIELLGFREFLAPAEAPSGKALATFAAGCFWGVELAFQRIPGVESTCVGYAQGHLEKPTYDDVCRADTGHTESVRVVYDPQVVSFGELLEVFWKRVGKNATTLNKAGGDTGPQYRSGIYYHSEEQKKEAELSRRALFEKLGETVVTEVASAKPFWLAEDYHQQYLSKGGRFGKPQSAEKGCCDEIQCYG